MRSSLLYLMAFIIAHSKQEEKELSVQVSRKSRIPHHMANAIWY